MKYYYYSLYLPCINKQKILLYVHIALLLGKIVYTSPVIGTFLGIHVFQFDNRNRSVDFYYVCYGLLINGNADQYSNEYYILGISYIIYIYIFKLNQLHAVSRIYWGQREPSIRTLCSPLFVDFFRGIRCHSEEIKIFLNIFKVLFHTQ